MGRQRVDGRKTSASLQPLPLVLVLLALGALAIACIGGGQASASEMRTRGVDRSKPSASLQRLLLAFVLLAVGALTTACISGGQASVSEPAEPQPAMSIEVPPPGQVTLPFRIAGWAVDLAAREGTGIDRVEVLEDGCKGTVIGVATYGIDRSDVGATFRSQFVPSGWQFLVEDLSPGHHTLGVHARSTVAGEFNDCRSLSVDVK